MPRWLIRSLPLIAGVALGFLLAGVASRPAFSWSIFPNRELSRSADAVRDAMKLVHDNYVDVDRAAYDRLAKEAIHGLVETLDTHSEFLEAREMRSLDEEMRGDFGGIGIQVESRDGRIIVIAPIAGTPGERAGILRGDEILMVDGVGVGRDTSLDDLIERLRGAPGTKVTLKISRPSSQKQIEMTLQRELIKVESVRDVRVIGDGIGYLQLVEFSEKTGDEFDKAIDQLLKQGVHSLILDLRNNPGGLLDAAVYVCEPFFRKGELIVSTKGRRSEDAEELRSESEGDPLSLPVAVLINAGSASASEIVAGALKDTGKAVIVGERSFGKGSVQTIFKIGSDEGMRLTTARYFTPSGVTIHGKGIDPQIEVVMSPEEDDKLRLQRTRGDLAPAEFKERFGFEPSADRQLDAAVDALKGMEILRRRGVQTPPARPKSR